jgi:dTDP-4-amino-4,6-dideoxygalactose transaminase
MELPFFDLKRQYGTLQEEIDDALGRVSRSGIYIGGEELREFEREAADYASVRHAIGLSSGTDALLASLMALGVRDGDEVITTPFTFIATAEVIAFLGATPVFVDVDNETFNLDPNLLDARITGRVKCIIPVHLFGQMSDMPRILSIAEEHRIPVLEDAAQAIGATIGGNMACGFGAAGCLSFFPTKNLGGFGDGGMVLTNSDDIDREIRVIKEHGSAVRYRHGRIGMNGRLDAIQAAVLRVKLRHLDQWVEKRREHAAVYSERLGRYVNVPVTREGCGHVYNQLTSEREGCPQLSIIHFPCICRMFFSPWATERATFPCPNHLRVRFYRFPYFQR